jgi:hypothetical protein
VELRGFEPLTFSVPSGTVRYLGRSPRNQKAAPQDGFVVELRGFEPLTFSLRTRRATNCATAPGAGEKLPPGPADSESGRVPQAPAAFGVSTTSSAAISFSAAAASAASAVSAASWPDEVTPVVPVVSSIVRTVRRARGLVT